jgi:hypothetical protein
MPYLCELVHFVLFLCGDSRTPLRFAFVRVLNIGHHLFVVFLICCTYSPLRLIFGSHNSNIPQAPGDPYDFGESCPIHSIIFYCITIQRFETSFRGFRFRNSHELARNHFLPFYSTNLIKSGSGCKWKTRPVFTRPQSIWF